MAFAGQGGLVSSQLITHQGIRLRDILPDAQFVGDKDVIVRSACGQWDECQANDIFVAIVGPDSDGHDFYHEAIENGAIAIVTERLLSVDRPQCIVRDSRTAYGKICQALAGSPSQRMTMIGVSGSDGKTVTSHLIRGILAAEKLNCGLVSSIDVELGRGRQSVPAEKSTAPMLAEQLTQMALADCTHAVIETSSVALAERSLSGAEFDVAVITNIRRDHLDFHGSTENYRRAQLRLLDYLKPDGMVVLNADDPKSHWLLEQIETPALTFGMKQEAHITATVIERTRSNQTFLIHAGCESAVVSVPIVGDQHIYNCLAAAAVGLALGIELWTIVTGLQSAVSIPGRLERIECGQAYSVWIDSARSPFQLATAIASVKQSVTGKLWCVCSTDDKQSELERRQMGEVMERSKVKSVLTKTVVDNIADYEPAHQVLDGFTRPESVQLIPNRFKAIEWALSQAKPGDAVLITGCGEKPFALVGDERWTISDRDVCQAWLYDHASLCPTRETESSGYDDSGPMIFDINDFR